MKLEYWHVAIIIILILISFSFGTRYPNRETGKKYYDTGMLDGMKMIREVVINRASNKEAINKYYKYKIRKRD